MTADDARFLAWYAEAIAALPPETRPVVSEAVRKNLGDRGIQIGPALEQDTNNAPAQWPQRWGDR